MSFGDGGSDIEVMGRDLMQMMPRLDAGGLKSVTTTTPGTDTPTVKVTSSDERANLVNDISSQYKAIGDEFGALRKTVQPGFSDIRKARLNAIETARRRNQQNLSGNFARRRLGGSSFSADSLARADREFGEATAAEEARTYLEELAATAKLIEAEGAMDITAVETLVNEMNLQANVASSIISGAQSSIGNAVNTTKNIEAARRAGQVSVGEFFSGLAAGAITQFTSGAISNAMNPGGGLFGSQSAGGDTSGFGGPGGFGGGASGGPGARGVGTTSSGGGGGGAAGMMPFIGSFFGG